MYQQLQNIHDYIWGTNRVLQEHLVFLLVVALSFFGYSKWKEASDEVDAKIVEYFRVNSAMESVANLQIGAVNFSELVGIALGDHTRTRCECYRHQALYS